METQDISELLERISGLNPSQLPVYQQAVLDNNINGTVLTMCDLDDLGKCLQMKFGDWQLFKSAIQSLRDAEAFPSATSSTENMDTGNVTQKVRSSIDSSKSIQFSKAVLADPRKRMEEEELGTRPKRGTTFKRQASIEISKDGSSSTSAFESIKEETEVVQSTQKDTSKSMTRKDSFVEQAMYESGLLHDFVQTFTEGVSEEDELTDNETTSETDKDLIDVNSSCSSIPRKKQPVQFTLSTGSKEGEEAPANDQESEKEPLIQAEKPSGPSSIFSSSTPILKLPVLKTPEGFEKLSPNKKSVPDFESEVTVHQELKPLIPVSKKGSVSSTGFVTLHPDAENASTKSVQSFEMVSVVDETKDDSKLGAGKGVSLEESIQQFTRKSLSGSQIGLAGSQPVDTSQRIQATGLKKDRNSPESFV